MYISRGLINESLIGDPNLKFRPAFLTCSKRKEGRKQDFGKTAAASVIYYSKGTTRTVKTSGWDETKP